MGITVSVENGLQKRAGYWTIIPPTAEDEWMELDGVGDEQKEGAREGRRKEMKKEGGEAIPWQSLCSRLLWHHVQHSPRDLIHTIT